uniref:Hexosyltransferase n=1 Tax=Clytia hemisphaerica TaxID=252671 RepID=A0A7M5WJD0_9CNID
KDIKDKMVEFETGMEKLVLWEDHQEHQKKLKKLFRISKGNADEMFHPNVLVDKIKFDNSAHYKVIILVTSFAKYFEHRQWIRKAWGNQTFWNESVENWQVIFNVGAVDSAEVQQKLVEESKNHGDMLILDVPENFHKLSEKVMAGLYWVYTKFSFEFVFKTDDDVFIHMQRLLTKLNTTWSQENYVGNRNYNAVPRRNKGRYGVSSKEWPGKYYDPYCSGGGY